MVKKVGNLIKRQRNVYLPGKTLLTRRFQKQSRLKKTHIGFVISKSLHEKFHGSPANLSCFFFIVTGQPRQIDSKHFWYYYEQPEVKRDELEELQPVRKKVCTSKKPAFSLDDGIGRDFLFWLCTTCGGGKNEKKQDKLAGEQ